MTTTCECEKYSADPRIPWDEIEMFGQDCLTCRHRQYFTGCEVNNYGKDAGDDKMKTEKKICVRCGGEISENNAIEYDCVDGQQLYVCIDCCCEVDEDEAR